MHPRCDAPRMASLETVRSLDLGDLRIREVWVSGTGDLPAHEHRRAYLTMVLSGLVTDRADDTTEVLRAGDLLFRAAGRHENSIAEEGSRGLIVELTDRFLEPFCRLYT